MGQKWTRNPRVSAHQVSVLFFPQKTKDTGDRPQIFQFHLGKSDPNEGSNIRSGFSISTSSPVCVRTTPPLTCCPAGIFLNQRPWVQGWSRDGEDQPKTGWLLSRLPQTLPLPLTSCHELSPGSEHPRRLDGELGSADSEPHGAEEMGDGQPPPSSLTSFPQLPSFL